MKTKVRQIICVVILMAISFAIGAICMYTKYCDTSWSLSSKITELSEKLNSKVEELALANEELLAQGELIHQYEAHDRVETDVENICRMKANIFAYADASIYSEEETPVCFGSTNLQIGDLVLTSVKDDVKVRYFLTTYTDKITVRNIMDERINVSYDASAFMREVPYQIISRNTTENLGAKFLDNYGNDTIHVMVADEGRKLLSTAEDEFIKQLKEEYAESETPVYVNGTLLKDWKESDKVIKA